MALKRRGGNADDEAGKGCADSGFEGDYPSLSDFLWSDRWPDDNSPRRLGTLTVFVEGGLWKACLNDRDQGMVAFGTSDTFLNLLQLLDDGLEQDRLDWRKAGQAGNARKRS